VLRVRRPVHCVDLVQMSVHFLSQPEKARMGINCNKRMISGWQCGQQGWHRLGAR
jgi:hypothetical protein